MHPTYSVGTENRQQFFRGTGNNCTGFLACRVHVYALVSDEPCIISYIGSNKPILTVTYYAQVVSHD